MPQAWNPNNPSTIGLEWFPVEQGNYLLDSESKLGVQKLRSKLAETIARIDLFVGSYSAPTSGTRRWMVEVYTAGNEAQALLEDSVSIVPNAQANNAGWAAVGAATVWQAVASGVDAAYAESAGAASVDFELNSGAWPLASRIMFIGFQASVSLPTFGTVAFQLVHVASGNVYPMGGSLSGSYVGYIGTEINPHTGLPWTPADLRGFDTGTYRVRMSCSVATRVRDLSMVLGYDTQDKRVAVGVLNNPVPAPGTWNQATMRRPDAATGTHIANWNKLNATTYNVVVRRAYDWQTTGGTIGWRYLRSHSSLPLPSSNLGNAMQLSLTWFSEMGAGGQLVNNLPAGTVDGNGNPTNDLFAIDLKTSAPAESQDSQPFAGVRARTIHSTGGPTWQQLPGAAGTYGLVSFLVKPQAGDDATPGGDLTVSLERVSDGVVMGSATIAAGDLSSVAKIGATGWRLVTVRLTPAPVLAAVQYRVAWTTTAVAGAGWQVAEANGEASLDGIATFDGTTSIRRFDGADNVAADFPVTLATLPAVPANFDAAEASQSLPETGYCSVETMPFVRVTWDATALGADFLRYEVQRSDDGELSWLDVGTVTTEAATVFDDFEHPFIDSVSYRIRTVRADLATSDWSAASSVAVVPPPAPVFYFTTNQDPLLNLAYTEVGEGNAPEHEYAFPDGDRVVLREMFGRDYFVAFRPTERRGVRFSILLLIQAPVCPPSAPSGRELEPFDALRELAHAQLPYVVVRNAVGDRWFAALIITAGRVHPRKRIYRVPVEVVQVAATPAPATPTALTIDGGGA